MVSESLQLCAENNVVPSALISKLLEAAYDYDTRIIRTKQRPQERYWCPGMDSHVEQVVTACFIDQGVDKSTRPMVPPRQPVKFPLAPSKKLASTLWGHLLTLFTIVNLQLHLSTTSLNHRTLPDIPGNITKHYFVFMCGIQSWRTPRRVGGSRRATVSFKRICGPFE